MICKIIALYGKVFEISIAKEKDNCAKIKFLSTAYEERKANSLNNIHGLNLLATFYST